jgi:hypothetical protein
MATKEQIQTLLRTNSKAVIRAVVVLNERQTDSEQCSEATINRNGRGFTPADARMGTSMANFYKRNGYLSEKQLAYWLKPNAKGVERIVKYTNQLLEISKEKEQRA